MRRLLPTLIAAAFALPAPATAIEVTPPLVDAGQANPPDEFFRIPYRPWPRNPFMPVVTLAIPCELSSATVTPEVSRNDLFLRTNTPGSGSTWRRAEAITAGVPITRDAACGTSWSWYPRAEPYGAQIFDGRNGDAQSEESDIGFRTDELQWYGLEVVASGGPVTVSTRGQSFTAAPVSDPAYPARFRLGAIGPGQDVDVHVRAEGAHTSWTVAMLPMGTTRNVFPAWQAGNYVAMARLDEGEPVRLPYETEMPATLDVAIATWSGQIIRRLAEQVRIPAGPGHVDWDGRGADGKPLPDGNYLVLERVVYDGPIGGMAALGISVDTTKPKIDKLKKPKDPKKPLALQASDGFSGVAATRIEVAGQKVSGSRFRPRRGWKRGRTYRYKVVATDRVGNARVVRGRFKLKRRR